MDVAVTDGKIDHLQNQVDDLSKKVDRYHDELLNVIVKKKKKVDTGDENEERGNWTNKFDFFLSCLGYAVGLGNVWRFPYLCYKNGGGAFFIPYTIMLGIVGIPIFFMELSLGQFSSNGPATCWSFARLFRGIGFGMVIVSALVAIYYNMIIGWAFYYLFASFTSVLPWTTCGEWSTPYCSDRLPSYRNESLCAFNNFTSTGNGTCVDGNGTLTALYNESLAKEVLNIKRKLPTAEYLERVALGSAFSEDISDLGPIRWQLVLCYLLAWIFVCATLSKGVKSSGKVVYFTATFPYVVLIILFIRGILLEGSYDGIYYYITPNLDRLWDADVWKDAAVQIFFSLSASWGGLIALSSYNKFHNDCFRDAIIVSFGNCLTSFFAGFVIFSYLGFLARDMGVEISEVADKGPTLAFVVYPFAVTKLPVSTLWAILFFVMLVTLGVDSQFVLVETVSTSFMDLFPKSRNYKTFVVVGFGTIFFLLGLTLTTNGGLHMLDLMDYYSGGWNVLVIALCECIALGYVYGVRRFVRDIEVMVGKKVCGIFPWVMWKYWWMICWCFLTPVGVSFILIYSWVFYTRLDGQPNWADALGWGMTLVVVVAIFLPGLILLCTTPGTFRERIRTLTTPTKEWGPALPKHRALVASYSGPNFVIDPNQTDNLENGISADDINLKKGLDNKGYPGYVSSADPGYNNDYDTLDQRL
ncbi:sodium- and chloride-dependent neutral and basic amino acid transporter B(0+) [Patella vulgata]|uniref:sodium- and chloride-dependent neutral and basic amino acid transporter B(0+) n=1 Tax=Patella vulgata TaxID=6465 RepID=UPI00217F733F|nr:sodium- and chloride-dependent neutral and basic amino acid transporter B(0+) [Patella vulgata]